MVADAPCPGAPLVLCFGFRGGDRAAGFDFARPLSRIAERDVRPINRLLLRDPADLWYQHGVPGLGDTVDEVVAALRRRIDALSPAWLGAVGQSMGGYAAMLFGALLRADHVLAFGPLSCFDTAQAKALGDTRWLADMELLDRFPPAVRYGDLPGLIATLPERTSYHIVYGAAPEATGAAEPNLDERHAHRFLGLPQITLEAMPEAPHAVAGWLSECGRMEDMLVTRLLPHESGIAPASAAIRPLVEAARDKPEDFDEGWRSWIAENLGAGIEAEPLIARMVADGVSVRRARAEIERARRSPYVRPLRRLGQRVAKRDWTLDVQRQLRALDSSGRHAGVERHARLDRAEFLERYYAANRPVILTKSMEDWPALGWTAEALTRANADVAVQVQSGRTTNPNYEVDAEQHRRTMPFGRFMAEIGSSSQSNDLYLTANNNGGSPELVRWLNHGIRPLPDYLDGGELHGRALFWIGPAGTVTPTHHDLTNNLFAQIVGEKRVLLVDALEVARLGNHVHVYSEVDLEAIDHDRFPAMRDVAVLDVRLSPGELLFIPIGWWHQVRSLSFSVSATFTNFVFPNDFHRGYRTYHQV